MRTFFETLLSYTLYSYSWIVKNDLFLIGISSGKEFDNCGYKCIEIHGFGYRIKLLIYSQKTNSFRWIYKERIYSKRFPYKSSKK